MKDVRAGRSAGGDGLPDAAETEPMQLRLPKHVAQWLREEAASKSVSSGRTTTPNKVAVGLLVREMEATRSKAGQKGGRK